MKKAGIPTKIKSDSSVISGIKGRHPAASFDIISY
jgi:hypothetical protein